jgi:hypothetical protein
MGKAFEYSVLKSIYDKLSSNQPVSIVDNSSLIVARNFYDGIGEDIMSKLDTAADAAIRHIVRLEPQLETPANNTPSRVPRLPLPTRILDISFRDHSTNTVIVTCNHGWSINMRIHNASSRIESSLKFDVKLEGMPPELYTAFEPWDVLR